MDVHPIKNVSIGIDPYPDMKLPKVGAGIDQIRAGLFPSENDLQIVGDPLTWSVRLGELPSGYVKIAI